MYELEKKMEYFKGKGCLTQRTYGRFFAKTQPFEEDLNKGIEQFSLEEIDNLLMTIRPKNSVQAKMFCSIINGYRRFIYQNEDNIFANVNSDFYLRFEQKKCVSCDEFTASKLRHNETRKLYPFCKECFDKGLYNKEIFEFWGR